MTTSPDLDAVEAVLDLHHRTEIIGSFIMGAADDALDYTVARGRRELLGRLSGPTTVRPMFQVLRDEHGSAYLEPGVTCPSCGDFAYTRPCGTHAGRIAEWTRRNVR